MANNIVTTLAGNLTDDPELRFLESGTAATRMRVAVSDSIQKDGKWEDITRGYFTVNVWRQAAEHAAEHLRKGDRVLVHGILRQRSYEDREGNSQWVTEVEATEVALSMLFGVKRNLESTPQGPTNGRKSSRRSKPREPSDA